ncbi:Uncharacterized protein OBRU01_24714 [Operophtera brumata]|uniref:Uncharacterized protein n=1 Tax=Operophtera brumata TaxID=104452 RepID=A0A0L7KKH1_OPEBR|nr:Uncharacterized protein OBRU01_24714 [Operophtera brumata]
MSDGYKPKKSKVFSVKNVETFLNEAPDKVFLAVKVRDDDIEVNLSDYGDDPADLQLLQDVGK